MKIYEYFPGKIPIIVSIPHAGTYIPDALLKRLTEPAQQLPDTDWHVAQLYEFTRELGVHLLVATHSRYVIDLNRAADGQSLYPGKFTTGLCPVTLFDGSPLYQANEEPTEKEIKERTRDYWQPYHDKLQSILEQLKSHKRKIVFDAHSICSRVPTLFEGVLPDLNIGTADGHSAKQELTTELVACAKSSSYTTVCNGRFKGGYITRHYCNPMQGIDAVQLELAQHNYMKETHPFKYNEAKAQELQTALRKMFAIMIQWVK